MIFADASSEMTHTIAPPPLEPMRRIFRQAIEATLASLKNATTRYTEEAIARTWAPQLSSAIPFKLSRHEGRLVISADVSAVSDLLPTELRGRETKAVLSDWAGELSNQFLGTVKHHLLPYGLVVDMGCPMSVSGDHLHAALFETSMTSCARFQTPNGRFEVVVLLEVPRSNEVFEVTVANDLVPSEVTLF